ncbi:MAG: dihydrodipicolinate synthase family protein [Deltaproteobacteria bacterium]|nr:dihydrodipicolinate synthase family protein [Deltaproteobacteria bacterium]MBI2539565.1 dihydrodipicolinate synthase family protein [Deltaproteobacteria bacterium]MBI2991236.1 dihydrodipicolinate synthase family protein [Deltaproteobacteria bacterium]MBI3062791.1 dihydrodipicolinate synthase family protein [Deltaproteobacteria bacterium]
MAHLAGTVIPLPTPFDERGEVDEKTFRQVIDFELDAKVDGLMVAGSYGQGPVMRPDQRMRAAEVALEQARGKAPVIVHVGAPDIQSVILLAEHSAKIGAAALLIVPPYYYTDHSEFELIEHYRAVARAVSLPIYIYNNKRYAGIDITPEFARRLAEEVPTIRGIKLAWGTLEESVRYLSALKGRDFGVFPGTPTETIAGAEAGVRGTIAPMASVFPELCAELWRAAAKKERDKALSLQDRVKKLYAVVADYAKRVGRTAFKELYRVRGIQMKMYPRWPAKQLDEKERAELRSRLAEAGWPAG